jgi:hypothetical protein
MEMEMGEVVQHCGEAMVRVCHIIARSVVAVGALTVYSTGAHFGIPFCFPLMDGLLQGYSGPPSRDPHTLLNAWCVRQHASYSQTRRILELLDLQRISSCHCHPAHDEVLGLPIGSGGTFFSEGTSSVSCFGVNGGTRDLSVASLTTSIGLSVRFCSRSLGSLTSMMPSVKELARAEAQAR